MHSNVTTQKKVQSPGLYSVEQLMEMASRAETNILANCVTQALEMMIQANTDDWAELLADAITRLAKFYHWHPRDMLADLAGRLSKAAVDPDTASPCCSGPVNYTLDDGWACMTCERPFSRGNGGAA